MKKPEAIAKIIEAIENETDDERFERLENKLDLILEVFVIPQIVATEIAELSPNTIRNQVLAGKIDVLQRDGSTRNYVTLKTVEKLKPRRIPKRRKTS